MDIVCDLADSVRVHVDEERNVTIWVFELIEEAIDSGQIEMVALRWRGTSKAIQAASHRGARGGLCGTGRGLRDWL